MLDLTPEQQVLREQFCSLRKEFTELFTRKNEMQTYEESSLTSLYLSTVGEKQHEVFCLRTKIAVIKLRIELIQAYINRNEMPELKTVDEEIHIRFADHKKKIEENVRQLSAAKEYMKNSFISADEMKEMKDTYRIIIKKLHPDINPGLSEYETELFIKAQAAYHLGSFMALREILLSLDLAKDSADSISQSEEFARTVLQLEKNVKNLRKQIEELERSFPFIYRKELNDKEWISSIQKKLDEDIVNLTKEKEKQALFLKVIEEWKPGLTN
jgi:hypothetical protein